jgi:uncharacterized protein Yka (UPF0111/DUF47 family)
MKFMMPQQQPSRNDLIMECLQSLNDINDQIMHLSETISKNAQTIRNTLEELMKEPTEQASSSAENLIKEIPHLQGNLDPSTYFIQLLKGMGQHE